MGDNNNDILDGVGKLFKMGVGAVAGAVEKGVNYVNEVTTEGTEANKRASEMGESFAKKGEELLGKTSEFGGQIKDKINKAMSGSADYDFVMSALDHMTSAELKAIKVKIEALIAIKPADTESPFAPQPEENKEEEQ